MVEDDQQPEKQWRRFNRLKVDRGALKRRARKIENVTLKHAHKFLIRRWTNARDVGRNTLAWLLLVGLLIGLTSVQALWFQQAYTTMGPAPGGTYAEAVLGQLETINPLFSSTIAETSATKLIFSSLLTYDRDNQLTGDVASSWSVLGEGKVYDVKLRQDVVWHDGQKLTVDDVIFTIGLMQNETTRALQYGNWAGVVVQKISSYELQLTLPTAYAPFAHSLTFGILPRHILKDVSPAALRENDFGRHPVGSGPFSFRRIQVIDPSKNRLVVHMEANQAYYRGAPILNRFQLHTYETRDAMRRAVVTNEVTAALGLTAEDIDSVTAQSKDIIAPRVAVQNGVYALFNTDSPLLNNVSLRQALLQGTNRPALNDVLLDRTLPLEGPLLDEHFSGGNLQQIAYDKTQAGLKLDSLGWKMNGSVREKDGAKLTLSMVAPDSGDYGAVVAELARQWQALGVVVKTELVNVSEIAQNYLQPRNYDVLVYELAVGSDPDVYAYWHSSQAKVSGLNLANYRSGLADDALSSARARLETNLRQAKYRTFVEQWLRDTPAIALYQPLLGYVSTASSRSVSDRSSVADLATRYREVQRWSVSEMRVMQTP